MRIEKVNDNQIRCTLTKEDLATRKLKINELTYGSDKAKSLFRDMMQQASFEFGFEAENIPLMIEAIPMSADCIVLIITKVEDPEELDTRFSKFAPSVNEETGGGISDLLSSLSEGTDDILDLFKKIQNSADSTINPGTSSSNATDLEEMSDEDARKAARSAFKDNLKKRLKDAAESMSMVRIYGFDDMNCLVKMAKIVNEIYHGSNSLFKDTDGSYLLSISKSDHSASEFNKVCNILAEYGNCLKSVNGSEAYLAEHHEPVISENAISTLAQL